MEEVKDINKDKKFEKDLEEQKEKKERRPIADLAATKINHEAVKVDLETRAVSEKQIQREKINSIIQQVNVAVQATEEISSIFDSITGIIEQAGSETASATRLQTLEREAKTLAEEITKIAEKGAALKDEPTTDLESLSAVEAKLSTVLNQLFPEASKTPITPAEISFQNKGAIENTALKVKSTKEQLELITKNIKETSADIRRAIELGEVAVENNEASTVMVRDVMQALEIAARTSLNINSDPTTAINAIGIKSLRPDLLKP